MHSSRAEDPEPEAELPALGLLETLGLGPGSGLLRDPKLFVDPVFLAALQVELGEELGEAEAELVLYQVGMIHGLRDALRLTAAPDARSESPSVAMRLLGTRSGPDGIEVPGSWPDRHEAEARLSRLGPAAGPRCALSAGYTSGWLSGTFDRDLLAVEEGCAAAGSRSCRFLARELEAWRNGDDARAKALVERVSFADLRAAALDRSPPPEPVELPGPPAPTAPEADDEATVHVWGPVMVMPFTGVDEALGAVDVLGRDPATRSVRAVVIDLRDLVLDEAFDAAGLEAVISAVEAWGAEALLTGISDLSRPVIEGLESGHLVVDKGVPEAIAMAFQIAEAQRHLL